MIKNFKRNDISTTPFIATKPWVITSFHNQDLVLIEERSSEIAVAEDFIDYEGGYDLPILNRECDIALEQQTLDKVIYEEGQNLQGTFYPDSDPINNTGTYKRLVYKQVKNSFYNTWNDPTKMFGLENIDFQLSDTKKFLSDYFRLFNISQAYFGEKMLENSIVVVDNSLDDTFEIVDDGNGNIIAKKNLFSKVQEVKQFINSIDLVTTSSICNSYNSGIELRQAGSGSSPYGSNNTSSFLPPSGCAPW